MPCWRETALSRTCSRAARGVKPMMARDALNLMRKPWRVRDGPQERARLLMSEMNWLMCVPIARCCNRRRLAASFAVGRGRRRRQLWQGGRSRALVATLALEEARKEIIGVSLRKSPIFLRLPQENFNCRQAACGYWPRFPSTGG